MSANIDKSLDEIVVNQRGANRGRGRGRRGRVAPVGGIKKTVAKVVPKPATKAAARAEAAKAATPGATKVIVSNLPTDVTEAQIKEYFSKSVGPVKRLNLTYGPNGQSRGIATIIFMKPSSGAKALEANGIKVDNKPMKIEAVFDASSIATVEPKSLSERVQANKPRTEPRQAKVAAPARAVTAARGGRGARGRTPRGRNASRSKPKTAEDLDAEMADYFTPTNGVSAEAPVTNGAAPTGASGGDDTGMDEIS